MVERGRTFPLRALPGCRRGAQLRPGLRDPAEVEVGHAADVPADRLGQWIAQLERDRERALGHLARLDETTCDGEAGAEAVQRPEHLAEVAGGAGKVGRALEALEHLGCGVAERHHLQRRELELQLERLLARARELERSPQHRLARPVCRAAEGDLGRAHEHRQRRRRVDDVDCLPEVLGDDLDHVVAGRPAGEESLAARCAAAPGAAASAARRSTRARSRARSGMHRRRRP